jgi:hypothetical protein
VGGGADVRLREKRRERAPTVHYSLLTPLSARARAATPPLCLHLRAHLCRRWQQAGAGVLSGQQERHSDTQGSDSSGGSSRGRGHQVGSTRGKLDRSWNGVWIAPKAPDTAGDHCTTQQQQQQQQQLPVSPFTSPLSPHALGKRREGLLPPPE